MLKIENLIGGLEDDFNIAQQEVNDHFKKEYIKFIKRNSSHLNIDQTIKDINLQAPLIPIKIIEEKINIEKNFPQK
jgi:hypothetical protein